MDTLMKFLDTIGSTETLLFVVGLVVAAILWAKGIFPVLWRLGNGLAKRKIAIFARSDNFSSLKRLLLDSRLFSDKNIWEITKKEDVGIAEQATLYLVFWHDWADQIDEILNKKTDACPLIIYAPRNLGPISEAHMKKLDGYRNTIVTNFRGRLLNDIVGAMITTSYEKS